MVSTVYYIREESILRRVSRGECLILKCDNPSLSLDQIKTLQETGIWPHAPCIDRLRGQQVPRERPGSN